MESSHSTSEPPISILDLPFDCLREVGQYLEPRDVTHVMATNWGLRSLITATRKHFPRQPINVTITKSAGVFEVEVTLGSTVHVGRAFDASVSLVDLFTKDPDVTRSWGWKRSLPRLNHEDLQITHVILDTLKLTSEELLALHSMIPTTTVFGFFKCDMREVSFELFYRLPDTRVLLPCRSSAESFFTADKIRSLVEHYIVTAEEADALIELKDQGTNLAELVLGWIEARSFPLERGRGEEWLKSKEAYTRAALEENGYKIKLGCIDTIFVLMPGTCAIAGANMSSCQFA